MKVLVVFSLMVMIGVCFGGTAENDFSPNLDNKVQQPSGNMVEDTIIRKINAKCTQKDVSSCLMLKLVTYMNRMLKKAAIQIGDDLEIAQSSSNVESTAAEEEQLARAGESDEEQVTQLLFNKVWSFLRSRSLKWRMAEDAELVVSNNPDADGSMNIGVAIQSPNSVGDGRGKMKNLAPFLAAAAVKIGLLGGLAFKGLALLVGKALLVSKIALLLASIIGLKKLFSHQKHVTYEVVSHPHHGHESSGHDAFSSGWGRELGLAAEVVAQELAYLAQKPEKISEDVPAQGKPAEANKTQ